MRNYICDCERGGRCTRTTMCNVQYVADDAIDIITNMEATLKQALLVIQSELIDTDVPLTGSAMEAEYQIRESLAAVDEYRGK